MDEIYTRQQEELEIKGTRINFLTKGGWNSYKLFSII